MISKPARLSLQDFKQDILLSRNSYTEDLIGKSLEEFHRHKFRGPQKAGKKRVDAVEEKKWNQSKAKYQELFRTTLDKRMSSVWNTYSNSCKASESDGEAVTDMLILGTKSLRDDHFAIANFGACNESRAGCIYIGKKWSLLNNDAMLLGSIHAKKPVYLHTPKGIDETLFINRSRGAPSILRRELSILHAAGYKPYTYRESDLLGTVLIPKDYGLAENFTLQDLCNAAEKPLAPNELCRWLQTEKQRASPVHNLAKLTP